LGNVDGLVPLSPCKHLDFSSAHPSYKLWDHSFSGAERDGVGDVAQVGLEAAGDVDDSQSSLEAGDFEVSGGELLAHLLLPRVAFIQLLASVEGVAVDGHNEAICNGMDGLINVRVRAEEYLGCVRGYWRVFLLSLVGGDGEAERWWVFSRWDGNSG